jgi:ribosomal protein S4E
MADQKNPEKPGLKNGDQCKVIAGTHKGKAGTVADLKTSKTGHITITVVQENGERFKTLGRSVLVISNKGFQLPGYRRFY